MLSMNTADRWTAIILAALGLSILAGGYSMDRLEVRQIHPASIPGLVPMALGVILTGLAAMLFAGAGKSGEHEQISFGRVKRLAVTALLCLTYAVGLVGTVPFEIATFLFISAFIAVFTWPGTPATAARAKCILVAMITGALASAAISTLFEQGFLVRLP